VPLRSVTAIVPDAVLAFLDATISPRGPSHWCWKYAGASEAAPSAFYWEDDGGRILGFIGLMRTTLHTAASRYPAAWFVDWHVSPGTRSGIGLGLLRKAEAEARILLTLQGTADTRSILLRLGWCESRRPTTWVRPLTGRFVGDILSRHAPRGLRRIGAALGCAANRLFHVQERSAPTGCALVDVERFGPGHDEVWRTRSREFAPVMARDGSYLDHFCADYPDGSYCMRVAYDGNAAVGHLIWRIDNTRRGLRRGRIVDVVWPRDDRRIGDWLVRAACCQMQEAGADYVECVASVEDLTSIMRHLRFRPRQDVSLWYHQVPEEAPPDTWYITLLDCDRAYR